MKEVLIDIIIPTACSLITGFITWLLTKKKYDSEVKGSDIQNMDQALEFYTKIADDMNVRLNQALERNQKLEDDVRFLKNQLLELQLKICLNLSCKERVIANEDLYQSRFKD